MELSKNKDFHIFLMNVLTHWVSQPACLHLSTPLDELSTYQQFPHIDSHSVYLQLCTEPFCALVFVLSISDASETLAGKSLTKFRNVLMKLSEIVLQFFYLLFPTHFPRILFACSYLMLIISYFLLQTFFSFMCSLTVYA